MSFSDLLQIMREIHDPMHNYRSFNMNVFQLKKQKSVCIYFNIKLKSNEKRNVKIYLFFYLNN